VLELVRHGEAAPTNKRVTALPSPSFSRHCVTSAQMRRNAPSQLGTNRKRTGRAGFAVSPARLRADEESSAANSRRRRASLGDFQEALEMVPLMRKRKPWTARTCVACSWVGENGDPFHLYIITVVFYVCGRKDGKTTIQHNIPGFQSTVKIYHDNTKAIIDLLRQRKVYGRLGLREGPAY
jgi:hypothetical protein